MKRTPASAAVEIEIHECICPRTTHPPRRFEITRCVCGKTWLACCEGIAQGFDTWQHAFQFADALSLRPRTETRGKR